jgi:hypothetical protein
MRLQDELREMSKPARDREAARRTAMDEQTAKVYFDDLVGRAKEAAKKGETSAHITIRQVDHLAFPYHLFEEMLKANFDKYTFLEVPRTRQVYVSW